MTTTYVYRTEQTIVRKSNPLYKKLDELCFKAKNIYNICLYEQRQIYFQYKKFINYNDLYHIVKDTEGYKELPNALGQQVVRTVTTNCNSFISSTKSYYNKPEAFTAKPKLPKYKDKVKGRFPVTFTYRACRIKEGKIHFHKIMEGFTMKTNLSELQQVQIVPRNNTYVINVTGIKEVNIPDSKEAVFIAGIDLGIDNFATITVWNDASKPLIINGKGLKSYNKYFNKKLAHLKSEAMTKNGLYSTKRILSLHQKRNNFMHNFMHQASKKTVDYLVSNNVKYLVIGKNKDWKQNSKLSKKVNQTFIQIPYSRYIDLLTYKAQEQGILVYHTEESYTSGTSLLDNEQPTKEFYNKSRRKHRGLFISNNGIKLNADVNASYQISKKIFKHLRVAVEQFTPQQLHNKLTPTILNVV
ncbi:MAG: transposase [Lachnospiraceae bacterium]|nr:transposase [Lachnospiraceae bacterium]